MSYLEEAAKLLRKVADANETNNRNLPATLNNRRIELAKEFAQLGAIDKGTIPADLARELLDRITERHEASPDPRNP